MYELSRILNWWPLKLFLSTIIAIFSPLQLPISILITLIIIDTITGSFYAMKMKNFNTLKFKKGIFKIATYFLVILIIRLLEIGISSIVNTIAITHAVTTYLIITEGLSSLENLTLLGFPVPKFAKDIILRQFDNTIIEPLFKSNDTNFTLPEDIKSLSESISSITEPQLRSLYSIVIYELGNFVMNINSNAFYTSNNNNDLFYYKVMASINVSYDKIYLKCKKENISNELVEKILNPKSDEMIDWKNKIKILCYKDITLEEKKQSITEDILLFIYKLVANAKIET